MIEDLQPLQLVQIGEGQIGDVLQLVVAQTPENKTNQRKLL